MSDDVGFLKVEMDMLWGRDAYGREEPYPVAAVAIAKDGVMIRAKLGAERDLLQRLQMDDSQLSNAASPDKPPAILEQICDAVKANQRVKLMGGPSYVFDGACSRSHPIMRPDLQVFTSANAAPPELAKARPENWWQPQEWTDLLNGRLGPWAIGVTDERVVTLCHTPRARAKAAEAGVWTHPDDRGRGLASIVTAAWASVAVRSFETLYYSTAATNTASRSVARKLKLRSIGWIWQVLDEN